MEKDFQVYMTAHIAKIVGKKGVNNLPFGKQDIISAIQLLLTCELYPIILDYVENNFTE